MLVALPLIFSQNRLARVACAVVLALHWYIVLMTGARGTFIAVLAAITFAALFLPRIRKPLLAWQAVGLALGALLYGAVLLSFQADSFRVVEIAPAAQLYANPLHPYTTALLSAIPVPDPKEKRDRIILKGDVPTARNPPSGCRFRTRCPIAIDECRSIDPELREISPGHSAACIRVDGYADAKAIETLPTKTV